MAKIDPEDLAKLSADLFNAISRAHRLWTEKCGESPGVAAVASFVAFRAATLRMEPLLKQILVSDASRETLEAIASILVQHSSNNADEGTQPGANA